MEIRHAAIKDLEEIKSIYERARDYMIKNGNPGQWDQGYPSEEVIRRDIEDGNCYLMEEEGAIWGVFVFIIGEEPSYQVIENGAWHADKEYGTIHRIASAGKMKGITQLCFAYCSERINYLRIDTHRNNRSMQAAILKYGFEYCGIIFVRNGERLAFDLQI